jgi:tetratricopeptide (TPR) repeat protein
MFTQLDSVIGNNVVTLLKNDWPFTAKKRTTRITESLFKQKNFLDSIALEYMENKITWADAHLRAATEYLRKDNIDEYLKYMNVLIYQYPSLKNLNSAIRYFYERNEIDPRDYTMKRIGIISLYNKNYKEAINNLSEYYKSNPSDTKVLFSLAESYYRVKDFDKALNLINECLKIDPAYPFGGKLRREIQDSINSR